MTVPCGSLALRSFEAEVASGFKMHFLHWLLPAQWAEDVFGQGARYLSSREWLGPAWKAAELLWGAPCCPPLLSGGIMLQQGESLALGQPPQARFHNQDLPISRQGAEAPC